MARHQIPAPGYLLSLAIAETIAERDSTFLQRLRAKLLKLREARGGDRAGDKDAVETIDVFLKLLDDPRERHA
jgi:hypothetical protein